MNKVIVLGRILPKSGKIHQNQEVYSGDGIMGTLKSTNYKDPPKVVIEVDEVANLYTEGVKGYNRMNGVVCGVAGVCQTIRANSGGQNEIKIAEPCIAAMRGRNPLNPTSRKCGEQTEQMLEIKNDGTSNTLTTVQKDNLVIEPMALDEQNKYIRQDGCVGTLTTDGSSPKHNNRVVMCAGNTHPSGHGMNGNVFLTDGLAPMLTTNKGEGNKIIEPHYRVRKLTPKECWRLMGFSDQDFDKAKAALNQKFYNGADRSNSQMYKQAGNSIVVNVLMAIKKQMLEATS